VILLLGAVLEAAVERVVHSLVIVSGRMMSVIFAEMQQISAWGCWASAAPSVREMPRTPDTKAAPAR